MKKTLPIFLAVVIVTVSLTGCQATPDKPVVIQKDLEQMIEKGMEQSETASPTPEAELSYAELCSHYGVPERFQTTVTEGKLVINCDVAIELPNTTALPMARVVSDTFSQEMVYAFMSELCIDTPMYENQYAITKDELEAKIIGIKAEITAEEAKEQQDSDELSALKSELNYFESLREIAVDSIEWIPTDGTLQTQTLGDEKSDAVSGIYTTLEATSNPEGGWPDAVIFRILNDAEYESAEVDQYVDQNGNLQTISPRSRSMMQFRGRSGEYASYGGIRNKIIADVTELSMYEGKADNCLLETTPSEARQLVEAFLDTVGTDDVYIDSIKLCSNELDNTKGVYYSGGRKKDEPIKHEYVFRLLRCLYGVKVESNHSSSFSTTDGMSVGKEWYYEHFYIQVDDEGISCLSWYAPLKISEVLTNNSAILPWSDIEAVFNKMMVIQNTDYVNRSDNEERVIEVTSASLSLQRVMERDSFTSGLLIPVWNFYGTVTIDREGEKQIIRYKGRDPLISISAIDGSVIDISKGY